LYVSTTINILTVVINGHIIGGGSTLLLASAVTLVDVISGAISINCLLTVQCALLLIITFI